MRVILIILAAVFMFVGGVVLTHAQSAVHEIEAGIAFVAAMVAIGSFAIVQAIVEARDKATANASALMNAVMASNALADAHRASEQARR